ncbi:MAG: response regulator [Azonexus sp.]|nr:response regulator [Azonexus sp.]
MDQTLLRVLVADDDPTVGLLMRAALGKAGFAVTVVDNGSAALAEFALVPFDMVLLDVEMPALDGFEVCAAIRQSQRPKTPVVLVTGRDDPGFLARAHELSADYIAKPVNWQALPGLLLTLLENPN